MWNYLIEKNVIELMGRSDMVEHLSSSWNSCVGQQGCVKEDDESRDYVKARG